MTPPQRVLGQLWMLEHKGETLHCLIVAAAQGEELRVLKGDDIYLSECFDTRADVHQRSEEVRLQHEYRGWLRHLTPTRVR